MRYDIHVYLGPTLDVKAAQAILPHAHYHPPIQCGDLLRLMRLDPKCVVIIDGCYEFTPAVWHKEILYAMDGGVEVVGAASMGALRAAELYHYGMKGIGVIFNDFRLGILEDDDEVAVLHADEQHHYTAFNEAMANIRATLCKALQSDVISKAAYDALHLFCKKQFYPYRSLNRAIEALKPNFQTDCERLDDWLATYGSIDLKKEDAVEALKYVHSLNLDGAKKVSSVTPITGYLKTLLNYTSTTPLEIEADWLPEPEKKFQIIVKNERSCHQLLAELVVFMKQMSTFIDDESRTLNQKMLLEHMMQNALYSPDSDFQFIKHHPVLSELYLFICQLICETGLTDETIEMYLPAIAHYYQLSSQSILKNHQLLKCLLVIILLMKTRYVNANVVIDKKVVSDHLACIIMKRKYDDEKSTKWLNPEQFDADFFMSFVMMYLHGYASVQTFSDTAKSNHLNFSKWIYSMLCCIDND